MTLFYSSQKTVKKVIPLIIHDYKCRKVLYSDHVDGFHPQLGVFEQLDLGNALRGGGDIISLLEKYPGRAVTIHLKPYSLDAGKDDPNLGFKPLIGEDDVPWHSVFDFCEKRGGTKWYIVEYESDAFAPLVSVEKCLQNLNSILQNR